MIQPATLQSILDGYHASYKTTDMTAASTRITAIDPYIVGGDGVTSMIYGSGDRAFIAATAAANDSFAAQLAPDSVYAKAQPFYSGLDSYLAQNTAYANLDAFATAQNAVTKYSWLISPNAAYLYFLANGKKAANMLTASNVWAPVTHLGSCTVGAAGAITFAAGSTIPTANVSGPPAVQGYAPAKGFAATVTTNINGTLTVTVTYNGFTSAGVPFVGHTIDVVLDNHNAGDVITVNPLAGNDRITQITAVAKTGAPTATAGAFDLDSIEERAVV